MPDYKSRGELSITGAILILVSILLACFGIYGDVLILIGVIAVVYLAWAIDKIKNDGKKALCVAGLILLLALLVVISRSINRAHATEYALLAAASDFPAVFGENTEESQVVYKSAVCQSIACEVHEDSSTDDYVGVTVTVYRMNNGYEFLHNMLTNSLVKHYGDTPTVELSGARRVYYREKYNDYVINYGESVVAISASFTLSESQIKTLAARAREPVPVKTESEG